MNDREWLLISIALFQRAVLFVSMAFGVRPKIGLNGASSGAAASHLLQRPCCSSCFLLNSGPRGAKVDGEGVRKYL